MKALQINLSQIPPSEVHNLCQTFLSAIKRFYDSDENMERFEEWRKVSRNNDKEKKINES